MVRFKHTLTAGSVYARFNPQPSLLHFPHKKCTQKEFKHQMDIAGVTRDDGTWWLDRGALWCLNASGVSARI